LLLWLFLEIIIAGLVAGFMFATFAASSHAAHFFLLLMLALWL